MYQLLLLLPLFISPAFAETIPDYNDPYSPIFTDKQKYSWTDKIKITIVAPSWNSDRHLIDSIGDNPDNPIEISTRENSLDQYRFTETDVNSGVFTAEVILTGFLHDTDGDGDFDTLPRTIGTGPTSGFLEVDRDSAITISFEFADGVVLTNSVPVSWNLGEIQFSDDFVFSDDFAVIQIFDSDMNLNPEALDQIKVEVYSDSDVAGITVEAIETSENSGYFVAKISLSSSDVSSGNRIFVLPGENIYAKYNDFTLPKPYSISDNLEIETFSKIDSSIIPLERIQNHSITFSDSFGKQLQSFNHGNPLQIVGTIENDQNFTQKFVYLIQVKDESNSVESLSWIQGELSSQQSLDVSQSWNPLIPGTYTIETFIWDSLLDPIALSPSESTMITVN